jgi:hypothetical protein
MKITEPENQSALLTLVPVGEDGLDTGAPIAVGEKR